MALENNVRVARERNQLTLILMIPAILFIYRYRLYDASFVQRLTDDWRLVAVAGVYDFSVERAEGNGIKAVLML